jgi:hypothetical protein
MVNGWWSLARLAVHLGESAETLRKKVLRAARGAPHVELDGIRFRKWGRMWKARVPEQWL